MEFIIQFEVPVTRLLGIVNNTTDKGLVFVNGKDRFTVKATYDKKGKLQKFIAFSSWDIAEIKKMWQVERRLKQADITFNVHPVKAR